MRDDRLLAVQRPPRRSSTTNSRSAARRCRTSSTTAARRLRLRGHAVQLHRHRRQPAHRAGADGQHVIWKPASSAMLSAHYLMRLLEAAGLPPGVINMVSGDAARSRTRSPTATSPACTSRAAPQSSTRCGRRSAPTCAPTAPTRASSARPAARISSSPIRRPTGPGRRGDRARGIRVSGPEVLGGEPRLRAPRSGRRARSRGCDDRRDRGGRRARLPELHGRGDRPAGIRSDHRLHRACTCQRHGSSPADGRCDGRLLCRADAGRDGRPGVQAAGGRDFRTGRDGLSLRRQQWIDTLALVDRRRPTR